MGRLESGGCCRKLCYTGQGGFGARGPPLMGCRAWLGWWCGGGVWGGDASGWDGEGKGAVKPSGSSLREVRCQLGMVALLPWDRAEQGLLRPGGGSRVSAAGIGWPQNWGGGGGDIQSWS